MAVSSVTRSLVPTTARLAAPPVTQAASVGFGTPANAGVDSTLRLSDAGLKAGTTRLTLSVDLKANQKYAFSFYYAAGGPKVTLTDSANKSSAVNMASGFSVSRSGTYKLTFDAPQGLTTVGLDKLAINARSVLPNSSDSRINALLMGGTGNWWRDQGAVATVGTEQITPTVRGLDAASARHELTYSFLDASQNANGGNGFQPMTQAQKDATRAVFAQYEKLINVKFTETSSGAGDINFGTDVQQSSAGYSNLPSSPGSKVYVYLANNAASNSDAGVAQGGYGWLTLQHEIGHALGLKHPGNYNAGGGGTPGPYLTKALDNRQNTMMSYYDNAQTRGVNGSTPMILDIAALQYVYGANTSAATTDAPGKFTFDPQQPVRRTLWSASGNDVIDLSGLQRSSKVNLNAGTLSSINITGPASQNGYSGNGNVGIAYGAKIDRIKLSNATGVADTVTLNDAFKRNAFNTVDTLEAGVDKIVLSKALFGSGLTTGSIEFGSAASKTTTRIVVNNSTGEVFYDADGKGKGAARKIAQFTTLQQGAALSASSFLITA